MSRILFVSEELYPFTGGGYISNFTLIKELTKKHEVHVLYNGKPFKSRAKLYPLNFKTKKGIWRKYEQLNKIFKPIIHKLIKKIKPDLIITHEYVIPCAVEVAKQYKIPVISLIRSYLHLTPDGYIYTNPKTKNFLLSKAPLKYKIQYLLFKKIQARTIRALKNSTKVIANSKYLAKLTEEITGIKCDVIYPCINLNNYKTKTTKEYITYINPDIHKGLNIIANLVQLMPNEKFLIVGKKLKSLPSNVKNIDWTNNIKDVYSKTKILLVPSLWPEPFGRVCIEAMVSGIPCIVSNKGGLPEAIADSGIAINTSNPLIWKQAILKLNNKKLYSKLSKKAVKQAKKFDFKKQFNLFQKLIKL